MGNAKTKRIGTISLLLLIAVFLTAACSQKSGTNEPSAPAASSTGAKASSPAAEAETNKEPIALKVFMRLQSADVQYFNNMAETPMAQEIMKQTGVKLEFIHPPVGKELEQFNLMVTSGDLPDIVVGYFDQYKGGVGQAIKDGLIIDVRDLVAEHAPNFNKLLQDDPNIAKLIKDDEGQLIGFGAQISNDQKMGEGYAYTGPMIRQDLLDKAGLRMPVTIDEWHNVLKTFKEQFALEAPIAWQNGNWGGFLSSAFNVSDQVGSDSSNGDDWFILDNNRVKFSPIEPGFKEYLTVLNQWYEEGLIQKDFPTQKFDDHILPMATIGQAGAVANFHTYWWAANLGSYAEGVKFVPAPLPLKETGQKLHLRDDWGWYADLSLTKYITKNNKYPKETIQFLDFLYSDESKQLTNWGIEGISYNMVSGQPEFSEEYKADPAKVGSLYMPNLLKQRIDIRMALGQYPHQEQHDAWKMWGEADISLKIPPGITPTIDEQAENTQIMTEVKTYVDEMKLKFIMGVESLDKFDAFVKQVNNFGIDKVIENKQAGLDRLNQR